MTGGRRAEKPFSAESAYARASALCAKREYASSDMHRKLILWGASAEEAAAVMARLVRYGFVDDSRYAGAYIREKLFISGWGRRKIAHMLASKGIPERVYSPLLEEAVCGDGERLRGKMEKVLGLKYRSLLSRYPLPEDRPRLKAALFRFAAGRGYGYAEVAGYISSVCGEDGD